MRITKNAHITGRQFAVRVCDAMGIDPGSVSSVEIMARAGSDLDSPLRITFEVMVYDEAILSLITEDLEPLGDATG